MITALIILGIIVILVIGFVQVYNRHNRVVKKIEFAGEYRNKFVELSKAYFLNFDEFNNFRNKNLFLEIENDYDKQTFKYKVLLPNC